MGITHTQKQDISRERVGITEEINGGDGWSFKPLVFFHTTFRFHLSDRKVENFRYLVFGEHNHLVQVAFVPLKLLVL